MLETFQAMQRTIWLHTDALYFRLELFEPARDAHECAAGSQAGNKMCNLAFGLLPDFHRGGVIMGAPIRGVVVLIGIKIFFGTRIDQSSHFALCAVGAFAWISENQLRAIR